MPLADTLLRMAETPRLFRPKWSDAIIAEVSSNLQKKWNKTAEQVERREAVLRTHFPEAWIEGYEPLIATMSNDAKDRHILAAAVCSGTKLIVTYNARHFPQRALEPLGIEVQGPSTFLINLYVREPGIVVRKLAEQAQNVGIAVEDLLRRLQTNVPAFVSAFGEGQSIELTTDDQA